MKKTKLFIILLLAICSLIFANKSVNANAPDYMLNRKEICSFNYNREYEYKTEQINFNDKLVRQLFTHGAKDNLENPDYVLKYQHIDKYDGKLYNDLDSLLVVLESMEDIAYTYFSKYDASDLILDYVRCIDESYYSARYSIRKEYGFNKICGDPNKNFINKVNELEPNIKIYFASFVQNGDKYNYELYGDIDSKILDRKYCLLDPLNICYNSKDLYLRQIDLIHMFTVMSGTYVKTGAYWPFMDDEYKDLIGWLGDLAQLDKNVKKKEKNPDADCSYRYENDCYDNTPISFAKVLNLQECEFPNEDLLGDIDGMNICRVFLNYNDSISICIGCYYNLIKEDNTDYTNRYMCFKFCVVLPYKTKIRLSCAKDEFQCAIYALCHIDYGWAGDNSKTGFWLIAGNYDEKQEDI